MVQPFAPVPVTVYSIFCLALEVTVTPVVALKPVAGDQTYVAAPLAVRVVLAPGQTDELGTDTVGIAFTVTVLVVGGPTQPAALVPIIV